MEDFSIIILFLFVLFLLLGSGVWVGLSLMGVAWVGMQLFTTRPVGDTMLTTVWSASSRPPGARGSTLSYRFDGGTPGPTSNVSAER